MVIAHVYGSYVSNNSQTTPVLKSWFATFRQARGEWNKIEHRMFCHIAENWRGQPLSAGR